jgi:hypothetical protein
MAVLLLVVSGSASAAPLTINFEGYFGYYDYLLGRNEFFDELDALATQGIYAGGVVYRDGSEHNASRVQLSVTIDDAVQQDPWTNWVLHSEFSLGPLHFSTGPADFLNLFTAGVQGSSIMMANGRVMRPNWVAVMPGYLFGNPGYNLGPDMAANLAHVWDWRPSAIMTWTGSVSWWAFYDLKPTSVVSVPEPSSLVLSSGALLAFVTLAYRRRQRS